MVVLKCTRHLIRRCCLKGSFCWPRSRLLTRPRYTILPHLCAIGILLTLCVLDNINIFLRATSPRLTQLSPRQDLKNTYFLPRLPGRSPTRDKQMVVRVANMHRLKDVQCQALFRGSQTEIKKAKRIRTNAGPPDLDDDAYVSLTVNCTKFQTDRGYIMSSLTKEEEEFPLAFSILTFKDSEMVERLLRAMYRPHNYYCIHVDNKSPDVFYNAMLGLTKCLPNVIMASRRIDVQWATFSVLEPDILCMEELWRFPGWKYFLTLTGQEFPLKTNHELVKIFTAYDGANDVEGTIKRIDRYRWNDRPPFGIRPVKGSVHVTVNRDFVDYVLHNHTAKALLEWVKWNTWYPEETFFATLNHNPQLAIRGTYKGDLPQLGQAKEYFANKFYLWEDRVVIGCLEEKIFNDTRDEYLGLKHFNVSYYASLDFVKNKV